MYKHFLKRIIDFFIVLCVLLIIWPFLLIVTILLLIFNEGAGAFFLQERPGYKGKPFKIIKFKTMNEKKGPDGKLLPDVQRITKFGRFVRNTSIDELPQLINVLKGDMAIIGPRPLLMQYLPLYSAEQSRRHDVRPGITGWAQCHGRNNLSWTKNLPTRFRPRSVWEATSVRGSSKCFTNAPCRASETPIPLRRCKTFCAVPKTVWAASLCRLWAK